MEQRRVRARDFQPSCGQISPLGLLVLHLVPAAFSRREHALAPKHYWARRVRPLVNCQRSNFGALNREVVIERDRTSVERSRYLYSNDEFCIVGFNADRLELEFISLDCLSNPVLDHLFAAEILSFVMHNRIVCKAGKNGFHIVRITSIDIIIDDSR